MSDIGYFSMYARFETESKEDAAAFLGADNIIGDAFSIEQEYVDGKRTAWIVNPFGKRMGTIDEKTWGSSLAKEYVPTSPLVAIPLRRSSKLMANGSLRGASPSLTRTRAPLG